MSARAFAYRLGDRLEAADFRSLVRQHLIQFLNADTGHVSFAGYIFGDFETLVGLGLSPVILKENHLKLSETLTLFPCPCS